MKTSLTLILALAAMAASAVDFPPTYSRKIFSDDFSGKAFDARWGHYKSGSEVRDGMLVGITPEGSDHSAVDNIRIEPERDLEVSVKFRFASDKAKSFNVWFDDKDHKDSHAGHICNVSISPKTVTVGDAKTGNMRNDIYEKRKSPEGLSAEDKAMLATKTTTFPVKLALGDWHKLVIRTWGEQIEVSINGKSVGTFKSEGIAHDHKTLVSLTTNPVDVHYDDFAIKAAARR